MDNIKEWTYLPIPNLLTKASCKKDWNRISAESSLMSPRRPNRLRDWAELNFLAFLRGGIPLHYTFSSRMKVQFYNRQSVLRRVVCLVGWCLFVWFLFFWGGSFLCFFGWWWWHFPHMKIVGEGLMTHPPPRLFSFQWRLDHMHQFHSFSQR